MAVLPAIQGNLLWRETTEARVKLLHSHAIRPEGGHLHGGNLLAEVVVERLQTCERFDKEVPDRVGRKSMRTKHYVILDHQITRIVLGSIHGSVLLTVLNCHFGVSRVQNWTYQPDTLILSPIVLGSTESQ